MRLELVSSISGKPETVRAWRQEHHNCRRLDRVPFPGLCVAILLVACVTYALGSLTGRLSAVVCTLTFS
jgi:hypothetical protein